MRSRLVALGLLGSMMAVCGCQKWATVWFQPAAMYADTRTSEGDGFTLRSPQWAYDGEPVTFDFQPDPNATDYVVFYWPDEKTDVLTRQDMTRFGYRGVGTFKAGAEPRANVVRGVAYQIRGACDWYYDKDAKEYRYYRTQRDDPDWNVGEASMEIMCYRVDIDIAFGDKERIPKNASLTIFKDDGTKAVRLSNAAPDQPGLELVGPDAKGQWRARCAPTWKEVDRVDTTEAELLVTYQDGTQETIRHKFETP